MIKVARMQDRSWMIAIAALWMLVMLIPTVERYLPASIWFEVTEVRVYDARAGQTPLMAVERKVHRPFQASWIAEVERWDGDRFEIIPQCTGRGENNFAPDNTLPKSLDLRWWVYPADCRLETGQYRIETRWTLQGGQQVRALSNIFAVTN